MRATGKDLQRLTHSPGTDWYPTWSPDGDHIAFQTYRNGNADIYVMDADGSNVRALTTAPEDDEYPAWSPFLPDSLLAAPD
jgi:Tol biopolymer transport system component